MTIQVSQMLHALAAKLGVTVEYLWGVLIKQAYISAITDLFLWAAVIIVGIVLFALHRRYSRVKNGYSCNFQGFDAKFLTNEYELKGVYIQAIMVVVLCIFICLFFRCVCAIPDTVSGLINPEYWALSRVLEAI